MIAAITMHVRFDVIGSTANELRDAAREMLEKLDPEATWSMTITATQMVVNGRGQVQKWTGEVEAHDLTERRTS